MSGENEKDRGPRNLTHDPLEYVDEDGRAMRSPLTDAVCATCGSRKVRVG